jgi:uncharacterized integral membrane protein
MKEPEKTSRHEPDSVHAPHGLQRDLRHYASQTNIRLFAGMLILLLIVGNGLVFLIYGEGAVRASLLCMLAFFMPVILISLLLALAGWASNRGGTD